MHPSSASRENSCCSAASCRPLCCRCRRSDALLPLSALRPPDYPGPALGLDVVALRGRHALSPEPGRGANGAPRPGPRTGALTEKGPRFNGQGPFNGQGSMAKVQWPRGRQSLDLGPWTLNLGFWTLDLEPLNLGFWILDFAPDRALKRKHGPCHTQLSYRTSNPLSASWPAGLLLENPELPLHEVEQVSRRLIEQWAFDISRRPDSGC